MPRTTARGGRGIMGMLVAVEAASWALKVGGRLVRDISSAT
jgi:hypothetical protein